MNFLNKALAVALLTNDVNARTPWTTTTKTYPSGTSFTMRYFSYVDEEQADLGAIFAPTLEVTFSEAEAPTDDSVVRLCLSYRFTVSDAGTATDSSPVESVCFYTLTNWAT